MYIYISVPAPQWWNELPADVGAAESLASFRTTLKTHQFPEFTWTLHNPRPLCNSLAYCMFLDLGNALRMALLLASQL